MLSQQRFTIASWKRAPIRILILLLSAALQILFASSTFSSNIHRTASVMFSEEKIALPPGKALHRCDSTTILSEEVLMILEPYHDVYINRSFNQSDSGYTLVEGRDGIQVERPALSGVFQLTFADSSSAARAVDELLHSGDVVSAIQNGLKRTAEVLPVDPKFAGQWHLRNTGQYGGTAGADIRATWAWEHDTGSVSLKIGIFDTGIDAAHGDLIGRVTGDGPGSDNDSDWVYHGTFVAGIFGRSIQ